MAWEDRTSAEQAQVEQEAAAYRDTDDNYMYEVTKPGVRYVVKGINSARVVAGKDGTIQRKGRGK
jgi:hypothetical protein